MGWKVRVGRGLVKRTDYRLRLAAAWLVVSSAHAAGARLFKSGPIQITADGAWVWTVHPDDASVSRMETASDAVARFPLPGCRAPEGLAVREDGDEVWVACRESDRVLALGRTGSVLASVDLPWGSGPYGVALSPDQRTALVTLSRLPGVAVLDVTGRRVSVILEHLESTPLGVAFTEDGQSAWVTHLRRFADMTFLTRIDLSGASPVVAAQIPLLPAAPLRSGSLRDPDPAKNVAEGGYLTFRGHLAQVPSVTGRREMWIPTQYTNVHETFYPSPPDSTAQASIRHLLLDTLRMPETLTDKVVVSAAQVHDPGSARWEGPGWDARVAGPVDIAFTADGLTACVVNEISGDLLVMPVATPAFKPSVATPPLPEIAVGSRPQGVALSPSGDLAYVVNRLGDPTGRVPGRTVSVVDLAGLRELRQVTVAPETFPADHLLGARLFHSSDDPRITPKAKVGCGTCHPGGEDDSSQWDMNVTPGLHGPRMVPSLLGLGLTMTNGERETATGYGLLHHSGDRDEVQDFDYTFTGVQLGGTGFLGAAARAELGQPNAGLSPELDALARYVLSLPPIPRSPHRAPDGALTAAATRGATFFMGSDPGKPADAACATCHDPRQGFVDHLMHDVGQARGIGENEVSVRTPPWELKTQTLVGIFATTPFEGNRNVRGQSRDMGEFLQDIRGPMGHGRVDGLTGRQLRDLHDFLLSIDGDMTADDVSRARDTTPPRLERVEPVSLTAVNAWFDESVDPVSAADPRNWTVRDETGATVPVTAAVADGQGDRVRLSVTLRAGCPPASYTVTAGAIRDLAGAATGGISNTVNPLDPRNERTFSVGDTITVTLGASGYEDITIPVHDAGMSGGNGTWPYPRILGVDGNSGLALRGFVRFEWVAAFAAVTGLASATDIVDASYTLPAEAGDAHDLVARRVLLSWQDSATLTGTPPAGSLTYNHHSTPSGAWNLPGAARTTGGVDGDDPADYDGLNDIGDAIDATAAVRSVKERVTVGGPGVTEAFRFWFDHPGMDYGHALELTAGDRRELELGRIGEGFAAERPVLTITYRVRGGPAVPREVSGTPTSPLRVSKASATGDSIRVSFEDLGPVAPSYAAYVGDIGTWYSHASAACGLTPAPMAGRREVVIAAAQPSRYILVTAANACAEGASGADSFGRAQPGANLDCPP